MNAFVKQAERNPLLVVGDPEECKTGGVSFSRFVLPFRYRLGRVSEEDESKAHFRRCESSDWLLRDRAARARYLTQETDQVLFGRAEWFQLEGGVLASYKIKAESFDGELEVAFKPPGLVLFEYGEPVAGCADVLRSGFLVIDLYFPGDADQVRLSDLQMVNELFRYTQQPFPGHENDYLEFMGDLPQDLLTASKGKSESDNFFDAYSRFWCSLVEQPVSVDGARCSVVPDDWARDTKGWLRGAVGGERGWATYVDERAFVWTCALFGEEVPWCDASPEQSRQWIQLLNVDSPSTNPATKFEKNWSGERTYRRWRHYGTLYGYTYHSGACAGVNPARSGIPYGDHFMRMYFDQILLLLYIRNTVFRFSVELNKITAAARCGDKNLRSQEEWRTQFQKLRWEFNLFCNLYQFPLMSNQQQGLELYTYARKYLDVDDLFEEVHKEIVNTHEYLQMQNAYLWSAATQWLAPILAAVSVAGALHDNLFALISPEAHRPKPPEAVCILAEIGFWLVLVAVLSWLFHFILDRYMTRVNNRKMIS